MATNDDLNEVQSTTETATESVDRRKLLGLLGAGSISLAGCLGGSDGSDGDDGTEMDEDATTAEDGMTTTEAGVEEADTTTASDETTTEDADTTSGGDSEANCADCSRWSPIPVRPSRSQAATRGSRRRAVPRARASRSESPPSAC